MKDDIQDVDYNLYEYQRREEILKGDYIQFEIVVGNNDTEYPITTLCQNGSTIEATSSFYLTLKKFIADFEENYPEIVLFTKLYYGSSECLRVDTETIESFEERKNKKEGEK